MNQKENRPRSDSSTTVGRRLRVLHVYRTYFPETQGGLQEAIRQISRGLRTAGCEASVFTLAKDPVPPTVQMQEGVVVRAKSIAEIASCDIGSPWGVAQFRKLAASADILNFHYPWPFGDLLGALFNPGKPYVITYHSDIVRQRAVERLYAPLRTLFFQRAAAVVATSQVYAMTSPYLTRTNWPVEVIPLGIDPGDIPAVSDPVRTKWKSRFPLPFFLFVGVLRYYKGLEFLIMAARINGATVVIAGDGPERERLKSLAEGMDNVHFVGHVTDEDKFALLALARSVVFPSHLRAEAFGVTLLEGAISACPLISTEIGTGTSYVNAHGETGLVVPPADPVTLSNAMSRLLNDEKEAMRMGIAARERCIRLFNTADIGRRYLELYTRICGGPATDARQERPEGLSQLERRSAPRG
ncbi:glycosyltransferase [Uliginosibacterium sp. H1]|uniref:glycosyltransferase n=1 Tax=Uliginosibacterium sp. H1 TaxID=3114757 RepID=UPI002E19E218|nr:glycosyltransferase [Uliginosibacterium sp. H1]